jgi:hypothetical protein
MAVLSLGIVAVIKVLQRPLKPALKAEAVP